MTEDADIRADRTIMLGLQGGDTAPRPMTAMTEGDHDGCPI